jgi:tRNA(fMet)-specific endonuclease VapC
MNAALLDTDTLSHVMRNDATALVHSQAYLTVHTYYTFSLITRYEIVRGLKARGATARLAAFEHLCSTSLVLPLTDSIILRATDIYADLYQRGELIGDADILIAATALEHGLVLVTNNTRHFSRVTGLHLDNWLVP